MHSITLLLSELHEAGHDAHHDYVDGEWILIMDGELVARAQSLGELADEGGRGWRRGSDPSRYSPAQPGGIR